MKGWVYIVIASICETGWFYCIRYLQNISFDRLLQGNFGEDGLAYLALLGYGVLGVINVIFFSMALKRIPAASAFATWTGLALLGTTLIDGFYLEYDFTTMQGVFMIMIVTGILGLRISSKSRKDKADT